MTAPQASSQATSAASPSSPPIALSIASMAATSARPARRSVRPGRCWGGGGPAWISCRVPAFGQTQRDERARAGYGGSAPFPYGASSEDGLRQAAIDGG